MHSNGLTVVIFSCIKMTGWADISAVGARSEITDGGDLYHDIVFPSYHGDNFSIPRLNYP